MKLVTSEWRRRDGKPLIAVYINESMLLSVDSVTWWEHWPDGRYSSNCEMPQDLLPVPREPTYRPFRDLREAFEVMGPTPFIRRNIENEIHCWFVPVWNPEKQQLQGNSMADLLSGYVWTSNPSDTVGKPCGVEVTQ